MFKARATPRENEIDHSLLATLNDRVLCVGEEMSLGKFVNCESLIGCRLPDASDESA